jgi:hypothetical protein
MQRFQNDGDELILAEFSVSHLNTPAETPLDGTGLTDWLAENFPNKWKDAAAENIKIGGISAVSISSPASEMAPAVKEIYFIHNGGLFQISMLNPNVEINSKLYESILVSFRFDAYAQTGETPLPPGKFEGMIAAFLWEEHPDLAADFEPVLQEMSMQGEVLKQVGARVFRITESPFENETFLISHSGVVIPMGTAVGGQGVSSMALSDLDQDGQAELYFTYSFGSGIHQTHLGVYAPAYDPEKIYAAETYYLGDLILFSDQQNQVGVRVVEPDPETKTANHQDLLGQLQLEKVDFNLILKLELIENLPEEIRDSIIQSVEPDNVGNDFWTVYEDKEYGVRFAVPCFWEVNFPNQYHSSGTAYPIRNYSEAFTMSFGKNHAAVWENGGIKIDMNFTPGGNWGLPADATLEDFLTVKDTDPDPSEELLSFEEVVINGQKGLLVTTKGQIGIHFHHLFKVSENLFLMFVVYPPQAIDNPDVRGILHSLALSPDIEVAIPEIIPGDSPEVGEPACLQPSE